MRPLPRLRSWLRAMAGRARMEREMADEMRFHVEAYTADLVRAGVPEAEARRQARLEFGALDARKEEVRQALGLRLADELRADVRYALRQLQRSPGFTAVAVLSLALGIGANTAIFSLMEAALWSPLPVERPEELRLFSWVSGPDLPMGSYNGVLEDAASGGRLGYSVSTVAFDGLRRNGSGFDAIFGFKAAGRVTAVIGGVPELVEASLVTGDFFRGLGVRLVLGRPLTAIDDDPATDAATVIGHDLWTRRFGRDPSVIGSRITVNDTPVTIVGVAPAGFSGVEPGRRRATDLYVPLRLQPVVWPRGGDGGPPIDNPDYWWLPVMGRLVPGANETQVQDELDGVMQQAFRGSLPERRDREPPRLVLTSGARGLNTLSLQYSRSLFVLSALSGVVLIIACANVANLLLARSAARRREIGLRFALGASRWRVGRQLLTEGVALAALAGVAGVLVGYGLRDAVPRLLASSWTSGPFEAEFSGRVLALSVLATIATGVLFSLAPAWRSAWTGLATAHREGNEASRPGRWRGSPLVAVQVALSVLLLVGAGLFGRTLLNLSSVSLGFQPDGVVLFALDPPRERYPAEARLAVLERLRERVGAVPGVERATLMTDPILTGGGSQTPVDLDLSSPTRERGAWVNDVGQGFFDTMGIPVVAGRVFGAGDGVTTETVAVVNRAFVREFFPNDEAPVGRLFRNGDRVLRIIGIVGDARYARLSAPFPATFYRLYLQESPADLDAMTFAVRTAPGTPGPAPAIREAVRSIDPQLPIFDVRTQANQIAATVSEERLFGVLTSAFALLALVLAAIGIYGVLANSVVRRTSEIGVRMALGAKRSRVLVMILRQAAIVGAVGAALGVVAAVVLTRFVQGMLFGVEPLDTPTFVAAVVLMLAVALLAGWLPARRAARLEPMQALRHE